MMCVVCRSERIIPMATIGNRPETFAGPGLATSEPAIVIHTNPQATLMKKPVYGRIHAWVCGECGHMQLFADNPQALYAAYEQFLRATQE